MARPRATNRLVEIRDNRKARIAETTAEAWLGEVEGVEVSIADAEGKLAQLQRRTTTAVDLASRPSQRDTRTAPAQGRDAASG